MCHPFQGGRPSGEEIPPANSMYCFKWGQGIASHASDKSKRDQTSLGVTEQSPSSFPTQTTPSLNPDTRDMVWESFVDEGPGMHFFMLCQSQKISEDGLLTPDTDTTFDGDAPTLVTGGNVYDFILSETRSEKLQRTEMAVLNRLFIKEGDMSNHVTLESRINKIRSVSKEVQAVCDSWQRRTKALSLWDTKKFISFDAEKDCFFIEYLPKDDYHGTGEMNCNFVAEGLDRIRQVALPFAPHWLSRTDRCFRCNADEELLPKHLYQFLGRTFPLLEHIWLVDYMTVKLGSASECKLEQHPCWGHITYPTMFAPPTGEPKAFASRNCIFREARKKSWKLSAGVISFVEWLQNSYHIYANASVNSVAEKPIQTRVGILGCEWKPLDFNGVTT